MLKELKKELETKLNIHVSDENDVLTVHDSKGTFIYIDSSGKVTRISSSMPTGETIKFIQQVTNVVDNFEPSYNPLEEEKRMITSFYKRLNDSTNFTLMNTANPMTRPIIIIKSNRSQIGVISYSTKDKCFEVEFNELNGFTSKLTTKREFKCVNKVMDLLIEFEESKKSKNEN